MTVIDTQAFAIPNDPAIIKKIKDACFEISASMSRTEGEKDFIKEAILALAKETSVPKKHLSKIAKLFHKSNKDALEAEQGATNELYDRIFVQVDVHTQDDSDDDSNEPRTNVGSDGLSDQDRVNISQDLQHWVTSTETSE